MKVSELIARHRWRMVESMVERERSLVPFGDAWMSPGPYEVVEARADDGNHFRLIDCRLTHEGQ